MTVRPLDTNPASWARYGSVLDGMDGSARVDAAVELSEAVREIRLAGIRARDPGISSEEAVGRLILEEFGVELPRSR